MECLLIGSCAQVKYYNTMNAPTNTSGYVPVLSVGVLKAAIQEKLGNWSINMMTVRQVTFLSLAKYTYNAVMCPKANHLFLRYFHPVNICITIIKRK